MNAKATARISMYILVLTMCVRAEAQVDPNEFFRVGDYRDIEVQVPKPGSPGAPPSHNPRPRAVPKTTTPESDFNRVFVRISIVEARTLPTSTRVIFRIDEMNPNGNHVQDLGDKHAVPGDQQTLLYAYLFVAPAASRMVTVLTYQHEVFSRPGSGEDLTFVPNDIYVHGVQNPLSYTVPLAVAPNEKIKENSFLGRSYGLVHSEPTRLESPDRVKTTAICVERVRDPAESGRENAMYFSENAKAMGRDKTTDSVEVAVRTRETQVWAADGKDWLWQEMERADAEGNVTMRCRRIDLAQQRTRE